MIMAALIMGDVGNGCDVAWAGTGQHVTGQP
jgi:hypothetical protein